MVKEHAVHCEVKKDGLRQTQDGGIKVTFSIHPDDMPASLYSDPMGQRYMLAIVALNDDETPRHTENKTKNYTAAAKLLAKDRQFWEYLCMAHPLSFVSGQMIDESLVEDKIERLCGVKSCAEIKDGTEAGRKFAALYAEFQEHLRWG